MAVAPTPLPQFIRARALAERLGISRTTLWRWQRQGHLPQPITVGTTLLYRVDVVVDHLARLDRDSRAQREIS